MAEEASQAVENFGERLTSEIENILQKIIEARENPGDSTYTLDSLGNQLEELKFGARYELEALKHTITNSSPSIGDSQTAQTVNNELTIARCVIKLQNLTFTIAEHLAKINKE